MIPDQTKRIGQISQITQQSKKVFAWRCLKCGDCCKSLAGEKFGAAITPEEKEMLEERADYFHVRVPTRPLTSDYKGRITLYQIAEDGCGFNKENKCLIYDSRPMFCRMFPMHPSGLCRCEAIRQINLTKPDRVVYPKDMQKACLDYMSKIVPLCKGAVWRFNLKTGWERNKDFTPPKTTDGDLKYADTYSYK